MGIFNLLKEVVDNATGGAISAMEADVAIRQLGQLEEDTKEFNAWFKKHSKSYTNLQNALNTDSFQVKREVFHANWLSGKAQYDGKSIYEEEIENNRRRELIEEAIKENSLDYAKELFKNYLSNTERSILDSYNVFRMFQNEISYLPAFQKEIVDSVYFTEIKDLFGGAGREIALTKIRDFAWQIQKHKTPAGHAIVLLMLAKMVYNDNSGFKGKIKTQIESVLSDIEDIVISNTCAVCLPENASDFDADTLLQTGKDFFLSGEPEKAFACYHAAAIADNIEAEFRVGLCFEKGYGVQKNEEKAVYWYKKSAESDNPVSKYYLAKVYHWLLAEDKRDYIKALELYKMAFINGVADAADNIGNMYIDGDGVEKNDMTAFEWYEKGATTGSPYAMYHLYSAYANGTGVNADSEIARQWFEKCVNYFDIPKYNLASTSIERDSEFDDFMSDSGLLTSDEPENPLSDLLSSLKELTNTFSELSVGIADDSKSFDSYSSERIEDKMEDLHGDLLSPGCDDICDEIASVYYIGSTAISEDVNKAIEWYERGASIGSVYSLDMLADIYIEKNWYSDAVIYARKSAECGYAVSMNTLGLRYYDGNGIDKDKVVADIWFLRAAKAGNAAGQYNIADSFLNGETGVPKDRKEALYWLEKSAAQGYENAIEKLAEIDEQDKKLQKNERAKEKDKLKKQKLSILSEIMEIDKNINAAQSPIEEENFIKEKESLSEELRVLNERISEYE